MKSTRGALFVIHLITNNVKPLVIKTLAETATTSHLMLFGTFDLRLLMSFVGTIVVELIDSGAGPEIGPEIGRTASGRDGF